MEEHGGDYVLVDGVPLIGDGRVGRRLPVLHLFLLGKEGLLVEKVGDDPRGAGEGIQLHGPFRVEGEKGFSPLFSVEAGSRFLFIYYLGH